MQFTYTFLSNYADRETERLWQIVFTHTVREEMSEDKPGAGFLQHSRP